MVPKRVFSCVVFIQTLQRETASSSNEYDDRAEEETVADPSVAFSHLRFLKPRTDTLRFDRDLVMEKIVKEIRSSKPDHRQGKILE